MCLRSYTCLCNYGLWCRIYSSKKKNFFFAHTGAVYSCWSFFWRRYLESTRSIELFSNLLHCYIKLTSTKVFGEEVERDLINTPDLLDALDRFDLLEWLEPTEAMDAIDEAERREVLSATPPTGVILTAVLDVVRLWVRPWDDGADLTDLSPLLWLCTMTTTKNEQSIIIIIIIYLYHIICNKYSDLIGHNEVSVLYRKPRHPVRKPHRLNLVVFDCSNVSSVCHNCLATWSFFYGKNIASYKLP